MKITQIQDETIYELRWYDRLIGGFRHRIGRCSSWCPWCITEADEVVPPVKPAGMVEPLFEIYDRRFKRHTGFGLYLTAAEPQAFLDGLESRNPSLRGDYVVRPYNQL